MVISLLALLVTLWNMRVRVIGKIPRISPDPHGEERYALRALRRAVFHGQHRATCMRHGAQYRAGYRYVRVRIPRPLSTNSIRRPRKLIDYAKNGAQAPTTGCRAVVGSQSQDRDQFAGLDTVLDAEVTLLAKRWTRLE